MKTYENRIATAKNLDDLIHTLNAIEDELSDDQDSAISEPTLYIDDVIDISELPVFGNRPIRDTAEIWSWDNTRMLVMSGANWKIENRCNVCGEAPWHCEHDQD